MNWWSRRRRARKGRRSPKNSRQQALGKEHAAKGLSGQALENQIRKNRVRWLKNYLTEEATRRAQELGWPNTYTFTKSLAESLIAKYRRGAADCDRASGDCRDFGGEAISRME